MPLPQDDTPWPPPDWRKAKRLYDRWEAWYSGDPDKLSKVYEATTTTADPKMATGAVAAPALVTLAPRMFWGVTPPQGSMRLAKLHVPLAAEIAATSADLLFGEPPAFRVPDVKNPARDPAQRHINKVVIDADVHSTLLEAAEICSAYGGVYLRVGWDKGMANHVLIDPLPPDAAIPQWRSGRLAAVTFWKELPAQDNRYTWRHLERHEPGRIWHGLYRSRGGDTLGERRPLTEHPDTRAFHRLANRQGVVDTGAAGMTAEYVPNMRPNRLMRGSMLGRSDYDGIEPVLDGLDEAWSSWMRDLRIGKGKVLVPEVYLQHLGRGKGIAYDAEQEVYQAISALPSMDKGMQLQVVQFAIRVAEHDATTRALWGQAVHGAGYSTSTLGEGRDGPAPTATEIKARWRRSLTTRGRKTNYFRGRLARLWETALAVDARQFGRKLTPVQPVVEWPDAVAIDPEQQARTLQMLDGARAVSTRTKVEMLHPDWSPEQVLEEVAAILAVSGPAPPDSAAPDDQQEQEQPPSPTRPSRAPARPRGRGYRPSGET